MAVRLVTATVLSTLTAWFLFTAPADPDATAHPVNFSRLPDLGSFGADDWQPETRDEQLSAEIGATIGSEGAPTAQQVVDALALRYPDIPGATASELPSAADSDPVDGRSGTRALALAARYGDDLTDAQRASLDALDAAPEDTHAISAPELRRAVDNPI